LCVLENLSFWRNFFGGDASDPQESLSKVGLDHAAHLPAAYLSAGQRRRLSIGRLLAVPRTVWLLDEPTSALDAAGQDLFAGLMRDHLARGGIIVAATHAPLGIETRELRMGATA
jgi:heme exporter protein A